MKSSRVAKRYARALYHTCQATGGEAILVEQGLNAVGSLYDFVEVRKVLQSPVMPTDVKLALLMFALKKAKAPEFLAQYIRFILDAGRVAVLPNIAHEFSVLVKESQGTLLADVKVASPLGDVDRKALASQLQKKFSKNVELKVSEDPAIGGGIWIGIGNSVIDLTLRSKLEALVSNATR